MTARSGHRLASLKLIDPHLPPGAHLAEELLAALGGHPLRSLRRAHMPRDVTEHICVVTLLSAYAHGKVALRKMIAALVVDELSVIRDRNIHRRSSPAMRSGMSKRAPAALEQPALGARRHGERVIKMSICHLGEYLVRVLEKPGDDA